MTRPRKNKPSPRHKARKQAVQAIYQWMFSKKEMQPLVEQFQSSERFSKIDGTLFESLVKGVIHHVSDLDEQIASVIHCELSELTAVELAVLRMATYELIFCLETPYRVIINESLELTKLFGTDQGYRFVNGVLDKLAQTLRPSTS